MNLLSVIFYLFVFQKGICQDTYNKTQSELIYNRLSKKCQQDFAISDTISCNVKGYDFTIYKTHFVDGYVNYGLKLFPDRTIVKSDKILSFIERENLFYILSSTKEQYEREKTKHVYFSTDKGSSVSAKLIYVITNPFQGYSINKEGTSYKIVLSGISNNKINIDFPANYTLITGRDKVGLQQLLYNELMCIEDNTISSYHKHNTDLLEKSDDIFMYKGKTFLIGEMNTNVYYQQDKISIVFDKSHSKESFSNLFMTDISLNKNIQVNLIMKNYNTKDNLQITLSKLVSHFDKGFVKYFGIEDISDNTIRGSFLLYNKSYSYMHLLDTEVAVDELFNENTTIKIKMYSYIPTHNIKDLFGI